MGKTDGRQTEGHLFIFLVLTKGTSRPLLASMTVLASDSCGQESEQAETRTLIRAIEMTDSILKMLFPYLLFSTNENLFHH